MVEGFFLELIEIVGRLTFEDVLLLGAVASIFAFLLVFNSMVKIIAGLRDTIKNISEVGMRKEFSGDKVMLEMTKANVKITENQLKLTEIITNINNSLQIISQNIDTLEEKIASLIVNQSEIQKSIRIGIDKKCEEPEEAMKPEEVIEVAPLTEKKESVEAHG